jgi:hypothetical protein
VGLHLYLPLEFLTKPSQKNFLQIAASKLGKMKINIATKMKAIPTSLMNQIEPLAKIFSTAMTAVRIAMTGRLINPTANMTSMNAQQAPTQYTPDFKPTEMLPLGPF